MPSSPSAIKKKFETLFGHMPQMFFAPGRINLIGEHVDYNNGFVMPAAIDKGVWFAVAPNATDKVHVYSADMDEYLQVPLSGIKKMSGWENYILGVVDQFIKNNYPISGFDAVFGGNLPVGAGLSSSAAVECGLAFALNTIFKSGISKVNIALLCQEAEHSFPGVQCGIMDMFASMMGEKGKVLLLDCDTLGYETLPFAAGSHSIVLINTNVHHSLAGGEYNKRRNEAEEGLRIIKQKYPSVKTFRDMSPQQVKELKNHFKENVYKRCLFITEEIQRTKQAAGFLKKNNLQAFGELMFETHEGLCKLYEVSCGESDFLVEQAKLHIEIIGARQMGGGFGGCTINIIQKENAENIISSITKSYKEKFGVAAEVYEVALSSGTGEIALH